MTNILFASDHHFRHRKIINPEFSPFYRKFSSIEEHDEYIIEQHNSVVRPNDIIWFGGDVMLFDSSTNDAKEFDIGSYLNRMNGRKMLLLGNHDSANKIEKYKPHFEKIVGYHEIRDIILTHIPVHSSQVEKRFRLNIHGHVHSHSISDTRYFNISMEAINYTPISLEEIKYRTGLKGTK